MKFFFILFLSIFTLSPLFANKIPLIKTANIKDFYYKQLFFDIQANYKANQQGTLKPRLHIFRYKVKEKDDFHKIVALFNTSIQTLSTLNQLSSPDELKVSTEILLCNRKGIFIPVKTPKSFLSLFMKHTRIEAGKDYPTFKIDTEEWYFLENETFSATEYAFFLKILYKYPLSQGVLTSDFGSRKDPLSNKNSWHKGIDIAAPQDSEVYAANDGIVTTTGYSEIYGNYILLKHTNGYETFYAHLNKIFSTRYSRVLAGEKIGLVGSTGRSTGPHLHFEIRKNGKAANPEHFLRYK